MPLRDSLRAIALTAGISVPTVLDELRGRSSLDSCDARLAAWSAELLRMADVHLTVEGSEHVPAGEALVVMSNHRSYYDVPTVFQALPGRLRMVAKKELFRVPVFGRAMIASGFVRIDRQNRARAVEALQATKKLIADGIRVWIAPEGTRSHDGRLLPFKSGGFHLALDTHVRILPVALLGTERVIPPDSYVVRRGAHVTARILPPIDAPSYGHERRKELMADVYAAIEGALRP